jgi:hypothetical protein
VTKPRPQCTATSKRSQERCKRAPTPGSPVCKIHGSASPQAKRKAQLRLVETEARARLKRMDIEPVTDPFTELQRLAGRALAWERIVSEVVDGIGTWRYESPTGEQMRAELGMFERALAGCRQTLVDLARLHVDDRVLRIREREADLFERAMLATFRDLQLTEDQTRAAKSAIVGHLRSLSAG